MTAMSTPGLRERKKRKTRWAIQEHALRLFAEQGYDATTVEQIAAAAEISPSTFFRYFPTKEDVVIQDEYDPLLATMLEKAPADLSPVGALRHTINVAFSEIDQAALDKVEERMRLILAVPALRARTLENLTETVATLAEPLARRVGRDPDDYAVRSLAGALIGQVLVATQAWIDGADGKSFIELVDEALAHLEDGFAALK
jgi:AcrR family transcriptional regulator